VKGIFHILWLWFRYGARHRRSRYFFETIETPPSARENIRASAFRRSRSRSSRSSDSNLAGSAGRQHADSRLKVDGRNSTSIPHRIMAVDLPRLAAILRNDR
jgi:hypothetical protein